MPRKPGKISWLALHLPQPFDVDHALGLMRSWASDQRSPLLLLEAVGQAVQELYTNILLVSRRELSEVTRLK